MSPMKRPQSRKKKVEKRVRRKTEIDQNSEAGKQTILSSENSGGCDNKDRRMTRNRSSDTGRCKQSDGEASGSQEASRENNKTSSIQPIVKTEVKEEIKKKIEEVEDETTNSEDEISNSEDEMSNSEDETSNSEDETSDSEEKDDSQRINHEAHAPENVRGLSCRTCESLPVSAGTIMLFEHFLVHLKERLKRQQERKATENGNSAAKNETLETSPSWQIPDFTKVELIPNSGVWIDASHLELHKNRSGNDTNKMTRLLLKELISETVLANSCALGQSDRAAINPQVLNAVRRYIETNFCGGQFFKPFYRVINLMCGQLRSEKSLSEK